MNRPIRGGKPVARAVGQGAIFGRRAVPETVCSGCNIRLEIQK
jgi:hypothetical protein